MIAFVTAFAVTTGAVALLLPLLHRRRIMDIPNARSSHAVAVPRGGGIAVMLGVVLAAAASAAGGGEVWWLIVTVCVALAAVGFMDDLATLGGGSRLVAQLVAGAVVMVWLTAQSPMASWPSAPFSFIVVVGFTAFVNAFNFMDGINGISALVALVCGCWFAWIGHDYGLGTLTTLGLATAGASAGFLPWNAPRARIFLGDVGSYAVGALLVGLALYAWAQGVPVLVSCAPLLVYLADTAWALVKRAVRRAPLSEAHREHVYQRLVDGGWSHGRASLLVAGVAAVLCLLALFSMAAWALAWALTAGTLAAYLLLPRVTAVAVRREASL